LRNKATKYIPITQIYKILE